MGIVGQGIVYSIRLALQRLGYGQGVEVAEVVWALLQTCFKDGFAVCEIHLLWIALVERPHTAEQLIKLAALKESSKLLQFAHAVDHWLG